MLESSFLLLGLTIVAGFFSLMFFERTKIPDVLLLMAMGVLVGPVFKLVDTNLLTGFAPFLGGIALIVIMFDGGMNLNIKRVLGELAPASAFTLGVFLATAALTTLIMSLVFNWPFLSGLLLGVIVGGTSSNIVIPIVSRLNVSENAKMLLNLEAALTDALCIVSAITLIAFMNAQTIDAPTVANSLLGAFAIAGLIGGVAGFAWLRILRILEGKEFAYMLTLAALFILYALIESVKANGAIGILLFGLIVGNSGLLLPNGEKKPLDQVLRGFQSEVSFFVRTFFFVYLGIIFNLSAVTETVLIISAVVLVGLFLARLLITRAFTKVQSYFRPYQTIITTMMPRGLAAAVLAGLPAANGIIIPNFQEVVFLLIVLTNLVATVGAMLYKKPEDPSARPRVVSTSPSGTAASPADANAGAPVS